MDDASAPVGSTATGTFFDTVTDHVVPTPDARQRLKTADQTLDLHRGAMLALPCMSQLELTGAGAAEPLSFPLTVAAWNLERCYYPAESAALLKATGAGIVLLSELDAGMARTGQQHMTRDVAARLSMPCAYAVEFLELGLGSETERAFCTDDANAWGFHGNALLSRAALGRPFLVRLDDHGHWFIDSGDQPRIGGRCAIGATIATQAGPLLAVSVHLESNADGEYRARQTAFLLDCLEALAPGLPVIVGGDLNTGNGTGGGFEAERLFAVARDRGFARHSGEPGQTTVRQSRINVPDYPYKLDWFLTRGVDVSASLVVPAVGPAGEALTDHEMVTLTVAGLTAS